MKLIKTLVLFAIALHIFSENVYSQDVTARMPDGSVLDTDPFFGKTRLGFSSTGARTDRPALSFQTYTLQVAQNIKNRATLDLALPVIRGELNGEPFSEVGNFHAGLGLRVLRLQEFHPLWLSSYLAVDLSQPHEEIKVASRYQAYTGALLLTKYFETVVFSTEGRYIRKMDEAVAGLDVGDEVQGAATLDIRLTQDWSTTAGWLLRRAAPLKMNGTVVSDENFYSAAILGLGYDLTEDVIIGLKLEIPTLREEQYRERIASFGSLKDQASLGRSWAVSLDMSL